MLIRQTRLSRKRLRTLHNRQRLKESIVENSVTHLGTVAILGSLWTNHWRTLKDQFSSSWGKTINMEETEYLTDETIAASYANERAATVCQRQVGQRV